MAGRAFEPSGPMVDIRVDKAYPGDEVTVKPGKLVRVRARVWGAEGFTTPTKLEIVRNASLDEIEAMIADNLAKEAVGEIVADKALGELALQREALRARVAEAQQR